MNGGRETMNKRINISLPEETVRLLDRVAEKGNRSKLINEAVRHYVEQVGRENLRGRLKKGAQAQAERDLHLVEEWFALDEEAWEGNVR